MYNLAAFHDHSWRYFGLSLAIVVPPTFHNSFEDRPRDYLSMLLLLIKPGWWLLVGGNRRFEGYKAQKWYGSATFAICYCYKVFNIAIFVPNYFAIWKSSDEVIPPATATAPTFEAWHHHRPAAPPPRRPWVGPCPFHRPVAVQVTEDAPVTGIPLMFRGSLWRSYSKNLTMSSWRRSGLQWSHPVTYHVFDFPSTE